MITGAEKQIATLRNEIMSQKVASGLAFSSLLLPENTPTASYEGTASVSGIDQFTPVARLRFRFTRSDGLIDPPLINFAFSTNFEPSYKSFVESKGFTISGPDLGYFDWLYVSGYIAELGDSYIDFYVDFEGVIRDYYFSVGSISFQVTCQAISNVKGGLVVERLI